VGDLGGMLLAALVIVLLVATATDIADESGSCNQAGWEPDNHRATWIDSDQAESSKRSALHTDITSIG
jgi:hypothetical protein